MGERTKISWTDHTFNPVIGCAKVSPGCDNCYAEALAKRRGWHDWQNDTPRHVTSEAYWRQPHTWNRRAQADGVPAFVFCASLADVFDPQWPDGIRDRLFELIRETPWLIWQLLTKRPQGASRFLPADFTPDRYPNVWLGFTAENQQEYHRRWPIMASIPATVRFVSYEPALGSLTLWPAIGSTGPLETGPILPDWVIWGGESGPGARPMDPAWARALTAQCNDLGIPILGKQWGTYRNNPWVCETGLTVKQAKQIDTEAHGKGGAYLDGVLWREFPELLIPPSGSDLFVVAE